MNHAGKRTVPRALRPTTVPLLAAVNAFGCSMSRFSHGPSSPVHRLLTVHAVTNRSTSAAGPSGSAAFAVFGSS